MVMQGPTIGSGGNSGFQAINWVARTGCKKIILLGYDMGHDGKNSHWHGDHASGLSNPASSFLKRCAEILDRTAPALSKHSIRVINSSRETRLVAFERKPIEQALELMNGGHFRSQRGEVLLG